MSRANCACGADSVRNPRFLIPMNPTRIRSIDDDAKMHFVCGCFMETAKPR